MESLAQVLKTRVHVLGTCVILKSSSVIYFSVYVIQEVFLFSACLTCLTHDESVCYIDTTSMYQK